MTSENKQNALFVFQSDEKKRQTETLVINWTHYIYFLFDLFRKLANQENNTTHWRTTVQISLLFPVWALLKFEAIAWLNNNLWVNS